MTDGNPMHDFLQAIEDGIDPELAAYLTYQSPAAIFRLLERGKTEQTRINANGKTLKTKPTEAGALEFWQAFAKAKAKFVAKHVKNINKIAFEEGDLKASKYMLEHAHPAAYGSQGSTPQIEAQGLGEIEA